MHTCGFAEPLQNVGEELIAMAVIRRDVGRGSDDDDNARAIHAERVQHAGIRFEASEVVLLLQARIATDLRAPSTESTEPIRRDRLRYDDACCSGAAERVL